MGFSVSGAVALVTIGLIVTAGMVYGTAFDEMSEFASIRQETGDDLLRRQNTEIDITDISLTEDLANELATVIVDVENNGSVALSMNGTDILIDNEYIQQDSSDVLIEIEGDSSRETWEPGETLHIEVTKSKYLTDNPDRVKIITETGVADDAPVDGGTV